MKEKEIQNLELKYEGVTLEYQYVNNLKNERIKALTEQLTKQKEREEIIKDKEEKTIQEKEEETQFYKKEFETAVKKLEELKQENEMIKNSRWWKLREKILKKKEKRLFFK